MLDAGLPVLIVAARQCHARVFDNPERVYAHALPGGDRLAAEALWRRVNETRALAGSEANDPCQT